MKEIEWKNGVIWACAGQSSQLITREHFKMRTGLNDKSINMIAKDFNFKFKN